AWERICASVSWLYRQVDADLGTRTERILGPSGRFQKVTIPAGRVSCVENSPGRGQRAEQRPAAWPAAATRRLGRAGHRPLGERSPCFGCRQPVESGLKRADATRTRLQDFRRMRDGPNQRVLKVGTH